MVKAANLNTTLIFFQAFPLQSFICLCRGTCTNHGLDMLCVHTESNIFHLMLRSITFGSTSWKLENWKFYVCC